MSKTLSVDFGCRSCILRGAMNLRSDHCLSVGQLPYPHPSNSEDVPKSCPLREGAITVALAGSEDKNPKKWTDQDMLDLIEGLLDYTHESHTVLGHDGRDAEYYFNLFVERKNNEQ